MPEAENDAVLSGDGDEHLMRVATWNLKCAVAPKASVERCCSWLETDVRPDIAVFTEAKPPLTPSPGWTYVRRAEGIGPGRRWGTVVGARGYELQEVSSVRVGAETFELYQSWPGAVVVCDVLDRGERWATVVGVYAMTMTGPDGEKCGHGRYSVPRLLRELDPLFESSRGDRILICGDLNVWPRDLADHFESRGLTDLIEYTGDDRDALEGCASCAGSPARQESCGHLWTHRNGGGKTPARQQIDFMFATKSLVDELGRVWGGAQSYPGVWDLSDHAPVVAEFSTVAPRVHGRVAHGGDLACQIARDDGRSQQHAPPA